MEIAVKSGNDLGPLADRATHTLDRPRTHVADCENAGHRGLQSRCRRRSAILHAGDDKTRAIDFHATTLEPVRGRIGADEQEKIPGIEPVFLRREPAAPAYAFERTFARPFKARDLGIEYQLDIRRRFNTLDQIARHAGAKTA